MASRITSDGLVRIPADILDRLGVGPGEEVDFKRAADGGVVLEKAKPARRAPIEWAKVIGSADAGMSGDELMQLLRGDD